MTNEIEYAEGLSVCCGAPIIEPDFCAQCKEHTGPECTHEETEVLEFSFPNGPDDYDKEYHDVCTKCGEDQGEHEPWTPDTLEEAQS